MVEERNALVEIRPAEEDDLISALDCVLSCKYSVEGIYPPPIRSHLYAFLMSSLESPLPIFYVAVQDGKVVGVLILRKEKSCWNFRDEYLTTPLLTIDPDFRRMKILERFVERAKDVARITELPLIFCVMTNEKAEIKDRVLAVQGGKYVGGNTYFEVD